MAMELLMIKLSRPFAAKSVANRVTIKGVKTVVFTVKASQNSKLSYGIVTRPNKAERFVNIC